MFFIGFFGSMMTLFMFMASLFVLWIGMCQRYNPEWHKSNSPTLICIASENCESEAIALFETQWKQIVMSVLNFIPKSKCLVCIVPLKENSYIDVWPGFFMEPVCGLFPGLSPPVCT
jgi:hypothetical protein